MAMDVLKQVLAELGASKDSGKLIGRDKLPLPFEAYIEMLLEDGIDFVRDVYAAGQPNRNHILFAKLMKMGYLKTMVAAH